MEKPYFAMLHNQKHTRLVPMADPEGELMMYETRAECEKAATNTLYGQEFGYEIFCEGEGV
jgi:hypothetical protein